MDILKTAALKLGIKLSPHQLEQFEIYNREMVDWNTRMNLTSVTGYDEVQITHFLDSLTVVLGLQEHLIDNKPRIIDVGTGAGLPGIPLCIATPDIQLILLEATSKKVTFLRYIADKLGLNDVEIVTGRAESIAQDEKYRETFDIVLSRAVAPLAVVAELTLPFCRIGGCFIAQKKDDIRKERADAAKAVEILGGKFGEIVDIKLEEFTDNRCLVIIDKIGETPQKYPRRPGVPAKRPLF